MKYYAIRQINGEVINKILTSWAECKPLINGVRAEYKSFESEKDAVSYLDSYIEEEAESDVLANPDNHIYYVDGSYLNDRIGWGFVYIKDNQVIDKMCGGIDNTEKTSRNITGELESAKFAIRHAISNGFKNIYIIHDYQGTSSYITESWQPDKEESKAYKLWVNNTKDKVSLKFVKVKGHTNNKFNDIVDELAKLGTTL